MLYTASDKSVLDGRGRVIFFSLARFISDISRGDDCFVCGAKPNAVPFNNEHVLPDWILRRFSLHGRSVTLPNGTHFQYGHFKIPCCVECNTTMAEKFEKPIRELFAQGPEGLSRELKENGALRLFCWLSLIFLKSHLKDKYLNLQPDRRRGEAKIGELHNWEDIHHIHCLARAFYTRCELAPEVIGSLLVLPAKVRPHLESFDYIDLSFAQTMLLRMDDTAVIAVLNDSGAVLTIYFEELDKIRGPLSPLQLREMAARFAAINIHLADRPRFSSDLNFLTEEYKIVAHRPAEWYLGEWQDQIQGNLMYHVCESLVPNGPERKQTLQNLKTGRYTFIVDTDGNFLHDHMDLAPRPLTDTKGE